LIFKVFYEKSCGGYVKIALMRKDKELLTQKSQTDDRLAERGLQ